ncbi:MAG: methyltransferase domain-containing protein [Spirochaetales bacterium]
MSRPPERNADPVAGDRPSTACLRAVLGSISARDVLDVGCGSGGFTRTLADMLRSWRTIVGIDPDKDSIDDARRLTEHHSVRYRILSADRLPFRDERFDVVAISNALHHLEDPRVVLAEMRRVCAPGGAIVVQELVNDRLSPQEENGKRLHHLKARIDRIHGRSHRPTYSRDEVRRLLSSCGVTIEVECEMRDDEPAPPGSDRVDEAIAFVADYMELVHDKPEYPEVRGEAERIVRALTSKGVATPPRFVLRGRFGPERDR